MISYTREELTEMFNENLAWFSEEISKENSSNRKKEVLEMFYFAQKGIIEDLEKIA